jgi:hypothetical protein
MNEGFVDSESAVAEYTTAWVYVFPPSEISTFSKLMLFVPDGTKPN